MLNLAPALGIALAVSVLGNVFLWHSRDAALERATQAEAARDRATADAKACSDGVAELRAEEARRRAAVEARARAAEGRVRELETRAQATLLERPAVPGDACASARILSLRKLRERRAGRVGP